MISTLQRHITFANVMSMTALFVALGGAAYVWVVGEGGAGNLALVNNENPYRCVTQTLGG
jgi:hypothetical protein